MIFVILGVISAIGVWYWRLTMAREAAREIGNIAGDLINAPRRLGFRRRANAHLVEGVDERQRVLADEAQFLPQAVEAAHGMEAAIVADAAAWERFTVIEARRILERLKMAPGGGIPALLECLPPGHLRDDR